jgi:tetratricopeptide (TPR) repeat protein
VRKLFERITGRLKDFLQQRDDAVLSVECRDGDCIAILKILEGLDEASASEFFWTYSGDFLDASSYASGVVKEFGVKHQGVRVALEAQNLQPWPPMPEAILDETRSAPERLRELMVFSRSLLPQPEGCSVVWVFCPLRIADQTAYARLLGELLRHEYPFPWFHHMRILVRQDAAQSGLSPVLAGMLRVDRYVPDLSDEAMENALEEEAADEELPLAERVQAAFISASRDFSYGRFDDALKKHEVVLRYHSAAGNLEMVALVLNSVGEIHQRLGREERAAQCYAAALEPASECANPPLPVLFNTLSNLARLRSDQSRFNEAEVYYEAGEKLATVLRNAPAKIQSLENLGHCQYMQGKVDQAVESWRLGAGVAGKLEQTELQASLLARLRQHFAKSSRTLELQEVEKQLASLPSVPVN